MITSNLHGITLRKEDTVEGERVEFFYSPATDMIIIEICSLADVNDYSQTFFDMSEHGDEFREYFNSIARREISDPNQLTLF